MAYIEKIKYSDTDGSIGAAGEGGAAILNDLTDVTITSVGGGDLLVYDSAASVWINGAMSLSDTDAVGVSVLGASNGGTGATTLGSNRVLVGNGTSPVNSVTNQTSGYLLTSTGTGTAPTFQAPVLVTPICIPLVLDGGAAVTWTDMPSAEAVLSGNDLGRGRTKLNLSNATQARLTVWVGNTAGATGALLRVKYATSGDDGVSYSAMGTSSSHVEVAIDGSTTEVKVGSWVTLGNTMKTTTAAGDAGDVFIGVFGLTGNGTVDPIFNNLVLQIR